MKSIDNEEYLISRLQQRDREAFQELFYSWHRPLCFFASRIIKDQDVAEDLVQDVFVAFWKYDLSTFPNEKTIRTFLYTSVRNGCLNYLRDLEIRARNDRKAVPESEEDQDCFLLRQMEAEVVAELFEAIDELPERCRKIFYMAYLQEKEEKQIAELLRVSVNTVKTQKQRAKAYLKGRLGELFVYMTLFFFEF
ncbi:MAG: RNA polymerase sigma factor [Odoribacter splanchnicus]